MKIKVIVVDMEIPPRIKRWAIRLGVPLGVLFGGAAVAWAAQLHTWNDGDTLIAADLNGNFSNLQGQITTLQGQVHPTSAFRAYSSAPVSIPNNAGTTVVFDNVDFDVAGEYSKSTGVFTVANAGGYYLHCGVEFSAPNVATDWVAAIQKNGVEIAGSDEAVQTIGGLSTHVEGVFQLKAGDLIKCTVFQNSGNPQSLYVAGGTRNSFSGARLY